MKKTVGLKILISNNVYCFLMPILLFGIAPKSKQKGLGLYSKSEKLRDSSRKHSKLARSATAESDSNNECFFRFVCLFSELFSVRTIFDISNLIYS